MAAVGYIHIASSCYSLSVSKSTSGIRRTTVELDEDALRRAQELLGTTTIRETIDRALHEVDRYAKLRRAADRIREGRLNIVTPDDLRELRRPRH
jgi:Arc/MetJ family transcription regulator